MEEEEDEKQRDMEEKEKERGDSLRGGKIFFPLSSMNVFIGFDVNQNFTALHTFGSHSFVSIAPSHYSYAIACLSVRQSVPPVSKT